MTRKKPIPRAETTAVTRNAILKTARALFDAEDYEYVTLRRIAAACGLTTGAIFAHFPGGKPHLYDAIYGHLPIDPGAARQIMALLVEKAPDLAQDLINKGVVTTTASNVASHVFSAAAKVA
jgi:AcrR family transcriptional regulator